MATTGRWSGPRSGVRGIGLAWLAVLITLALLGLEARGQTVSGITELGPSGTNIGRIHDVVFTEMGNVVFVRAGRPAGTSNLLGLIAIDVETDPSNEVRLVSTLPIHSLSTVTFDDGSGKDDRIGFELEDLKVSRLSQFAPQRQFPLAPNNPPIDTNTICFPSLFLDASSVSEPARPRFVFLTDQKRLTANTMEAWAVRAVLQGETPLANGSEWASGHSSKPL